jgi:hypothetical protein
VAYKRISDNEFEVYHGCEATDGGAREPSARTKIINELARAEYDEGIYDLGLEAQARHGDFHPPISGEESDDSSPASTDGGARELEQASVSVPVKTILAIWNAMIREDYTEAYHQLYSIADPTFSHHEPWEALRLAMERKAGR